MPTSSVGSSGRRGVTLIEMLVVVAIIGIMLAVVSPSISAGLDAIRMTSATTSVAAFLNAAVNRAERRQTAVEVTISFKENKLTMYSNEAGFQNDLKLPDGILIDAVLPRTDDDIDGVRRLILMPGDSVPGLGIQLANRRGGRRIIRLDPMTGFPRTESVQPQ
jgi:prepilin-type N-terminal cleavage/methylation domain-containing protein